MVAADWGYSEVSIIFRGALAFNRWEGTFSFSNKITVIILSGATTPMQIMFSVSKGSRPDISEESIPADMPHRDVFISLMQSGWASDPNDRPAFLSK